MKKVAVVILNWNGEKLLKTFLPSVTKYTCNQLADIVVADNASTDNSVLFVKENYPNISIIQLSENYGFAEGYNQALKLIDNQYYVLLNSDVEVTENWLEPLVAFMDENNDVASVQPKLLAQHNKEYFEYAGAAGGFIDKYGYPFCRGRIFDCVEKDSHQYDNQIDVFWTTGACMLIRASEFCEAGGFDSSFFAHMEEIDLCWRLNARGKRLVCLPTSTAYHVGGATLNEESPRKTFLNFRNNLLMLYKNLSDKEFRKIYRVRIILDNLAAALFVLKAAPQNAKAIRDAHSEFRKIKKNYTRIKDENIVKQTTKEIETILPKSILWQFHVKRLKKFSSLIWRNLRPLLHF